MGGRSELRWRAGNGSVDTDETTRLLDATEASFRLFVDSVQDYAMFLLDPTGRVISWNVGAERINGYTASEIIGQHFSIFYPPEDVAVGKCVAELEAASREGRFEDEGWRLRKDGTRLWANVIITALRNEERELVGFAKVTRDLTERRLADERLRKSEARFRSMIENLPEAVLVLRGERIVFGNTCLHELLGYDAGSLIDKEIDAFVHPEDLAMVRARLAKLILERTPNEPRPQRWLRADGRSVDVEVSSQLLRFDDEELPVAVGRDVTDRTRIARALEARERLFRSLVGSMVDTVFTVDPSGRYSALYGKRVESGEIAVAKFVGKTASQIFSEDAAPHEDANRRALSGERVTYEWSVVAASGETRHFQTSLSPLEDERGTVVGAVGVARDVTEAKRGQGDLLTADRMASIGMLAAGVVHEINNPLAAIVANLGFARESMKDDARAALEALEDTQDAAERIRELLADLRMLSHGAPASSATPADVERALRSAARLASHQLVGRAQIVCAYGHVPPAMGNEPRLTQVFLNLIVNAAQAIAPGHSNDHEIRLVTRSDGDSVVVEVRDDGPGMTAAVQRKLFTPFFTTKPPGVGTGLGLSICQQIVSDLGGRIEVESEAGRGSTFRVILRAAPQEATPKS